MDCIYIEPLSQMPVTTLRFHTQQTAPPPQWLSSCTHTPSVRFKKRACLSGNPLPRHGFSPLHQWHFISVCLRRGHPVVPLFTSPSSCFCLPTTQSSPLSCTSVSFSSLVFLSLLLDPQIPPCGRFHSDRDSTSTTD